MVRRQWRKEWLFAGALRRFAILVVYPGVVFGVLIGVLYTSWIKGLIEGAAFGLFFGLISYARISRHVRRSTLTTDQWWVMMRHVTEGTCPTDLAVANAILDRPNSRSRPVRTGWPGVAISVLLVWFGLSGVVRLHDHHVVAGLAALAVAVHLVWRLSTWRNRQEEREVNADSAIRQAQSVRSAMTRLTDSQPPLGAE